MRKSTHNNNEVVIVPKSDGGVYIFNCPHCYEKVMVHEKDINCEIFRHAWFRRTAKPIPPHSKKATIDQWVRNQAIYGCGKPFRLTQTGHLSKCGYI